MKAAVIGVGHLGKHHARIYAGMDGIELCGVVDLDETAGKEIAGRHGAPWLSDYRDLPTDVALVSVATPTGSHHEIAKHFGLNYKTVYYHVIKLIAENRLRQERGKLVVVGSEWIQPPRQLVQQAFDF